MRLPIEFSRAVIQIEQGVEENIRTKERCSDRRLEKTA
jgi:hypothetical protein